MQKQIVISQFKAIPLLLLVLLMSTTIAAQGPLKNTLEVFLVSQVNTQNGVEESLVRITEAKPGDTLEYVSTYENTGNSQLSGFSIKNPIPNNTSYISGSENASVNAEFKVSVDNGVNFETEPLVRNIKNAQGQEDAVVVPAEQYTILQWRINDQLAPNESMVVRYRVVIK